MVSPEPLPVTMSAFLPGFGPGYGWERVSGAGVINVFAPTTTDTGTVWRLLPDVSRIMPLYVPATRPSPGKLAGTTDTVSESGAVAVVADSLSQFPPSEVLGWAVQTSVPVPALRMGIVCAAGVEPMGTIKKSTPPGISAK